MQALFYLQSETSAVISMPGGHLFMEPYMPDPDLYMPAIMYHAYGNGAKALMAALDKNQHLFTIEEALAPFPHPDGPLREPLLPMVLTPDGFAPCVGAHFQKVTSPSPSVRVFKQDWYLKYKEPQCCPLIAATLPKVRPTWPPLNRPNWVTYELDTPSTYYSEQLPPLEVRWRKSTSSVRRLALASTKWNSLLTT
jgi:hypothetical protein